MPSEKGYFALRLKELRRQAGLSQPQLAERSGVSVGTIRQFEQGRREPTYATLVKLVEGLAVSLAAFEPPAGVIRQAPAMRSRKPRRI